MLEEIYTTHGLGGLHSRGIENKSVTYTKIILGITKALIFCIEAWLGLGRDYGTSGSGMSGFLFIFLSTV